MRTTRNGLSVHLYDASALSISLSMSYGSYSGLEIQEPVKRKRKEFIIASKVSSSRKAEQYVIPPIIQQLRGLPKSVVMVRNARSNAYRSGGGIAQWLTNLSWRPYRFRYSARGW